MLSAHFSTVSCSFRGIQLKQMCDQILQRRTRKLPARFFGGFTVNRSNLLPRSPTLLLIKVSRFSEGSHFLRGARSHTLVLKLKVTGFGSDSHRPVFLSKVFLSSERSLVKRVVFFHVRFPRAWSVGGGEVPTARGGPALL